MGLMDKLFGTRSEREVKRLEATVKKIEALEAPYSALSNAELQAKTDDFRARFAAGETLDDLLPEANVGYAFFLSRHVTIEPEVYYELSTKSSNYSGLGLKLGFALYF